MLRNLDSIEFKKPKFKRKDIEHPFKKSGRQKPPNLKIDDIQELPQNEINFIFVGEVNVGKSSIINCILNAEECPIGIRRTTLTNTLVSSDIKKFFNSNNVNLIDTTAFDNKSSLPNENINLIDTSAFNKSNTGTENQNNWLLSQIDRVSHLFFVTNYEKCFDTDSELSFFETTFNKIHQLKKLDHLIDLTVIVNKSDQSNSKDELKSQLATVKDKLSKYSEELGTPVDIICLSAKGIFTELQKSLQGKKTDPSNFIGYEHLTKVFRSFFKNTFKNRDHFNRKNNQYYINKEVILKENLSFRDLYQVIRYLNYDFKGVFSNTINKHFDYRHNFPPTEYIYNFHEAVYNVFKETNIDFFKRLGFPIFDNFTTSHTYPYIQLNHNQQIYKKESTTNEFSPDDSPDLTFIIKVSDKCYLSVNLNCHTQIFRVKYLEHNSEYPKKNNIRPYFEDFVKYLHRILASKLDSPPDELLLNLDKVKYRSFNQQRFLNQNLSNSNHDIGVKIMIQVDVDDFQIFENAVICNYENKYGNHWHQLEFKNENKSWYILKNRQFIILKNKEVFIDKLDNQHDIEMLDSLAITLDKERIIDKFDFKTSFQYENLVKVIFNHQPEIKTWVHLPRQDYQKKKSKPEKVYKNNNWVSITHTMYKQKIPRHHQLDIQTPFQSNPDKHDKNYTTLKNLITLYEDKLLKFGYSSFTIDDVFHYSFDDISSHINLLDNYFISILNEELITNSKSQIYLYLKYKTGYLFCLKQYYEQILELDLINCTQLRKLYIRLMSNPVTLDYDKHYFQDDKTYQKYNFVALETYIIKILRQKESITSNLSNQRYYPSPIKLFDIPNIKEELVILVDRENVTLKEIRNLLTLKGNYKILSFISCNNIKPVKNEELIKVKNIGKNSADFQILLYAQELLLTTDKKVVIFTNDHFAQCIENNSRYLHTMDKNFISVYFNCQSFKDSNSKINQVSEARKEELSPILNNNLNQEFNPEKELEIDQSDNLKQKINPEKVDISDIIVI